MVSFILSSFHPGPPLAAALCPWLWGTPLRVTFLQSVGSSGDLGQRKEGLLWCPNPASSLPCCLWRALGLSSGVQPASLLWPTKHRVLLLVLIHWYDHCSCFLPLSWHCRSRRLLWWFKARSQAKVLLSDRTVFEGLSVFESRIRGVWGLTAQVGKEVFFGGPVLSGALPSSQGPGSDSSTTS